jgi:hypothetical protein
MKINAVWSRTQLQFRPRLAAKAPNRKRATEYLAVSPAVPISVNERGRTRRQCRLKMKQAANRRPSPAYVPAERGSGRRSKAQYDGYRRGGIASKSSTQTSGLTLRKWPSRPTI